MSKRLYCRLVLVIFGALLLALGAPIEETQATSLEDLRLAKEIRRRINDDQVINSSHVSLTVRNGVVTLFGAVDSLEKSRRVELITLNTPGVQFIDNRIDIYDQSQSPRYLEQESLEDKRLKQQQPKQSR